MKLNLSPELVKKLISRKKQKVQALDHEGNLACFSNCCNCCGDCYCGEEFMSYCNGIDGTITAHTTVTLTCAGDVTPNHNCSDTRDTVFTASCLSTIFDESPECAGLIGGICGSTVIGFCENTPGVGDYAYTLLLIIYCMADGPCAGQWRYSLYLPTFSCGDPPTGVGCVQFGDITMSCNPGIGISPIDFSFDQFHYEGPGPDLILCTTSGTITFSST